MITIGEMGPATPNYYADTVEEALGCLGHAIAQPDPVDPRDRNRLDRVAR